MSLLESTQQAFGQRNALPSNAWKDRLREKATMRRGSDVITFFVSGHTYEGSHRTSIYKYPESNRVSYHRIGDDSTKITIPALIVSEEVLFSVEGVNQPAKPYHDVRDRMMTMLQKGGTVMLDHPYLGVMKFYIESFTVNEEVGQFAFAEINIQGYKVDKRNFRKDYSATEASNRVQEYTVLLQDTVKASVDNGIQELQKVGGDPNQAPPVQGWVQKVDEVLDNIDNVAADIEQVVVSPIKKAQKFLEGTTERIKKVRQTSQRLYAVKKEVAKATYLAVGLFYNNRKLWDTIIGAMDPGFNPFGEIPYSPVEQTKMIIEYSVGIPQAAVEDPFTLSFEGIISRIVMSQTISHATALASNATYESQQDVEDARGYILQLINGYLSYDALTYEEREAMMSLKSATIEALYTANVVETRTVTPERPTPLLLVTYRELGGTDRLDEVAKRNNILDPFSVTSEVVL